MRKKPPLEPEKKWPGRKRWGGGARAGCGVCGVGLGGVEEKKKSPNVLRENVRISKFTTVCSDKSWKLV